jgi:hypothetical protein
LSVTPSRKREKKRKSVTSVAAWTRGWFSVEKMGGHSDSQQTNDDRGLIIRVTAVLTVVNCTVRKYAPLLDFTLKLTVKKIQ